MHFLFLTSILRHSILKALNKPTKQQTNQPIQQTNNQPTKQATSLFLIGITPSILSAHTILSILGALSILKIHRQQIPFNSSLISFIWC
jgi:coproporphyrinogen III oxidase-like Fe-S oxidoreductase